MPECQPASSIDTAHSSLETQVHVITGPVKVRRRGDDPVEPDDPVTLTPDPPPPPPPINS